MFEPHSGLDVLDEEPGVYVFAAHRNVNIMAWVGSASGETTDRIESIVARQVPGSPQGLSTVHVMTPQSTPPSAEARRGFAETARRWERSIRSVSLVIERSGFWGSAMRSAITGIQLVVAPRDYPIKVHASVEEAAIWLQRNHLLRSGVKLDPMALLAALEGTRNLAIQQAQRAAAEISPTLG